MKSYNLPAAVLLAASGLLLLGIATSLKHAALAGKQVQADHEALELARQELAGIDTAARIAAARSAPAEQFLSTWSPRLANTTSIDVILGRLDTLAVDNLLSPSGKSFNNSAKYFFNGRQLPVQTVNITVAGDFSRTLNWLGSVEQTYPLARVQQISYTAGGSGNSLAMAAQLVFPQKFAP